MKAKKIILTTSAFVAAGALVYTFAKIKQEEKRAKNQEELVRAVRDIFETMGDIATVYVELYKSNQEILIGGVVFEDRRHFTFHYENGELFYEEETI